MRIYYEQHGHGPDVVLVHGWGLHGGVWADVARGLSTHGRITVPDLPGHGRSRGFLPREYTPEILAGEIRRVAPSPAVWVGWSLGGLVALAAAQQFPQAVARLVLVGATPKFVRSADWPHGMEPAVLEQFARDLEQDYAAALTRFLSLQVSMKEDRAVLRRLRSELFHYGEPAAAALREGLRLLKEEDRRAVLPGIARPTLVIHGWRDRLVSRGAGEFLAQRLPDARLEMIPGAAHAPFLSHQPLFLQKLTGWIHA